MPTTIAPFSRAGSRHRPRAARRTRTGPCAVMLAAMAAEERGEAASRRMTTSASATLAVRPKQVMAATVACTRQEAAGTDATDFPTKAVDDSCSSDSSKAKPWAAEFDFRGRAAPKHRRFVASGDVRTAVLLRRSKVFASRRAQPWTASFAFTGRTGRRPASARFAAPPADVAAAARELRWQAAERRARASLDELRAQAEQMEASSVEVVCDRVDALLRMAPASLWLRRLSADERSALEVEAFLTEERAEEARKEREVDKLIAEELTPPQALRRRAPPALQLEALEPASVSLVCLAPRSGASRQLFGRVPCLDLSTVEIACYPSEAVRTGCPAPTSGCGKALFHRVPPALQLDFEEASDSDGPPVPRATRAQALFSRLSLDLEACDAVERAAPEAPRSGDSRVLFHRAAPELVLEGLDAAPAAPPAPRSTGRSLFRRVAELDVDAEPAASTPQVPPAPRHASAKPLFGRPAPLLSLDGCEAPPPEPAPRHASSKELFARPLPLLSLDGHETPEEAPAPRKGAGKSLFHRPREAVACEQAPSQWLAGSPAAALRRSASRPLAAMELDLAPGSRPALAPLARPPSAVALALPRPASFSSKKAPAWSAAAQWDLGANLGTAPRSCSLLGHIGAAHRHRSASVSAF